MKQKTESLTSIRKNYIVACEKRSEIVVDSRLPHTLYKPYTVAEYPEVAAAIEKYHKLSWLQKRLAKLLVPHENL